MDTTKEFRTHTGEVVTGSRVVSALAVVADFYVSNAYAVRREDSYASHVTEARKEAALQAQLRLADAIRAGEVKSFAVWQRVNTELTGECIALLGGN